MRTRAKREAVQSVAIVSANPETVDGLESYLRGVGMAARGSRRLESCSRLVTPSTVAVVLFPDDFSWETVLATLAELASRKASMLRLLVTGQPSKFERLAANRNVIVVPRPAWGWTILDAIRAHLDGNDAADVEPA